MHFFSERKSSWSLSVDTGYSNVQNPLFAKAANVFGDASLNMAFPLGGRLPLHFI